MFEPYGAVRRFGWIVILTTVGVAVIAVGVAHKVGGTVSAKSVVLVSPGTATGGPGAAQEARALATTYAHQLASDQVLLRSVGAKTGLGAASARRAIATHQVPDTAVIDVTFSAPTARAARLGIGAVAAFVTRPPATSSLSNVAAEIVSVSGSATPGHKGFSAVASIVIPSTSATPGPGNADQANATATILTGVIPQDHEILATLGRQLSLRYDTVKGDVSAASEQSTSLIDLSFTSKSTTIAQRGAIALAQDVSGTHPSSPNIPPDSLSVVSLPGRPAAPSLLMPALPVGVILGALLGVVLMVGVARARPQVTDVDALSALAKCPSSAIEHVPLPMLEALIQQSGTPIPRTGARVAIVPVTPSATGWARSVERSINALASTSRTTLPPSADSTSLHTMSITSFGISAWATDAPNGSGAAEREIALSDLVVIVVITGTPDGEVLRVLRLLRHFGRPPVWALLRAEGDFALHQPRSASAERAAAPDPSPGA